jgi:hypothetical protein
MKIKTYDLVKSLLEENSELRNSDKKLFWKVYDESGFVDWGEGYGAITEDDFMKGPSFETIRRCRQMIQAEYPELQATESVREKRHGIEEQRGTHVFRDVIGQQDSLL